MDIVVQRPLDKLMVKLLISHLRHHAATAYENGKHITIEAQLLHVGDASIRSAVLAAGCDF